MKLRVWKICPKSERIEQLMKLTLFLHKEFNSMVLPDKYAGQYWIRGKNTAGKMTDIVVVEALRSTESGEASQWILRSNRRFKIIDLDQVLQLVQMNIRKHRRMPIIRQIGFLKYLLGKAIYK